MRKHLQFIATTIVLCLTLTVLLDSYICKEEHASKGKGAPVDCCLQTCPAHNLAPSPKVYTEAPPIPSLNSFFIKESFFHSPLLADSIFHPPRV